MHEKRITLDLVSQFLLYIETRRGDAAALQTLRGFMTQLILDDVIDRRSSLVDLSEYCDELIDLASAGKQNSESAASLRTLIEADLAATQHDERDS